ncbi:hypothetical protein K439DRAFT_173348 [Ramaria rubella]|nr:hypothetical protein K439DRAFT_173348 [Ramaria rubella]
MLEFPLTTPRARIASSESRRRAAQTAPNTCKSHPLAAATDFRCVCTVFFPPPTSSSCAWPNTAPWTPDRLSAMFTTESTTDEATPAHIDSPQRPSRPLRRYGTQNCSRRDLQRYYPASLTWPHSGHRHTPAAELVDFTSVRVVACRRHRILCGRVPSLAFNPSTVVQAQWGVSKPYDVF